MRLFSGNPVQNLCCSAANGNMDNAAILNRVGGVEEFSDVMELKWKHLHVELLECYDFC